MRCGSRNSWRRPDAEGQLGPEESLPDTPPQPCTALTMDSPADAPSDGPLRPAGREDEEAGGISSPALDRIGVHSRFPTGPQGLAIADPGTSMPGDPDKGFPEKGFWS
jgi:hypothetical protein